jgi:ribosomal protein S27AE
MKANTCQMKERIGMEASKCPKCGEEPSFLEHMEKWYCYECNSYVDESEAVADEVHAEEVVEEEVMEAVEETVEEKIEEVEAESPVEAAPESVEVKEPAVKIRMCSNCDQPLKWIEKYQRYYCYSCKKYAPVEKKAEPEPEPEPKAMPEEAPKEEPKPVVENDTAKKCPECSGEMKFIEKYSEWYCHACKKYPLHKPKEKPAPKEQPKGAVCPKCSGPMRFIEKYGRHYCNACKAYAPKGCTENKKLCPTCKSELKYIKQYNEWYCYECKRYPLRPSKPVLLL